MKTQQGFTLIELIIVIVILGILAATAVPKFVSLSGDARAAVMKAVEGSMRSANLVIYARAAAESKIDLVLSTVTIDGQTINIRYGYANSVTDLRAVLDLSPAADFEVNTATAQIRHKGAIAGTNCSVTYTRADVNATTSSLVTPIYTLDVSNCS